MADQKELIRQLAEKYHVSKTEAEKAIFSQFKFTKNMMEQEDLPSIRIPYFGLFKPNLRKLKHLRKNEHKRTKTNEQSSKENKEES